MQECDTKLNNALTSQISTATTLLLPNLEN
jgi:hypothetical protein